MRMLQRIPAAHPTTMVRLETTVLLGEAHRVVRLHHQQRPRAPLLE